MSNASARQEPTFPWDQVVPETAFWNDIDHNAGRTFFMTISDAEISRIDFDESLTKDEKYKLLRDTYTKALAADEKAIAPASLRETDFRRWIELHSAICSINCLLGDIDSAEILAREVNAANEAHPAADGTVNKSGRSMLMSILEQNGKYAESETCALECLDWIQTHKRLGPYSPQALGTMRCLIKCVGKQGRYDEAEEWVKKCEAAIEAMSGTDFKKYVPEEKEALEDERKSLEEWEQRRASKI